MKLFFSIFALALTFCSCEDRISGSGNLISQNRNVKGFESLSAAGGLEVDIVTGNETKVVVEADDNLQQYIITEVNGSNLRIHVSDDIEIDEDAVKVHVIMPTVLELKASAAAFIRADGLESGSSLKMQASSGSKIDLRVDAPKIEANASSGADISLRGICREVSADASSGAAIHAGDLKAETADGEASSGAAVTVFGSLAVKGSASSGGKVRYTGGAQNVSKHESSAGSVQSF